MSLPWFGWRHFAAKDAGWWNPPQPDPFVVEQLKLVSSVVKAQNPDSILEIGVGRGRASPFLKGNWSYTAVEVNRSLLWEAKDQVVGRGVCATATNMPFQAGSFDVVVAFDVFMHIWERGAFLAECRRTLAPRGMVILNFLRRFSRGWGAYILALGRHPVRMWRARDRRFDSPEVLQKALEADGFSTEILMAETSVPILIGRRGPGTTTKLQPLPPDKPS